MLYQKFLNYLSEQDYSTRTIEIIHTTFSNAMEIAVYPLKKIDENPCKRAVIPKKAIQKKKALQYMKSDDIAHFLKIARQDNYMYWIYFKTLIETGMRKGEAASLQTKDIDLENGLIFINKTLDFQAKEGESMFGDTKTFDSERIVTMGDSLKDALTDHLEYLKEQRSVYDDIYKHELDLVFCRNNGDILPKSTLHNAFNRINKKAGLENLPIHALRHTHAVILLESGASMKFVQERLGHKNISITSDVYSHISSKIEKTSMDGFNNYINEIMS